MTASPPLVSVVIPSFNQARFLPDCFRSLQAQSYPHWEAIVVNDGSSDETKRVVRGYLDSDARFKYIEQKNLGQPVARNRGLRAASGTYIQFLDSDDALAPAKFELQLDAIRASDDLALALCDYTHCAEDDISRRIDFEGYGKPRFQMSRPIEDIASRWETEFSIPIHCFLFDARLFRDHGIYFDERLQSHEDWDCWMRIFALNPRVVHVQEELAFYRYHLHSVSRNLGRMRKAFRAAVDAQLALCATDAPLRELLEQKRAAMDAHYLKKLRAQRRAWWQSHVPGRVQRVFDRLFERT